MGAPHLSFTPACPRWPNRPGRVRPWEGSQGQGNPCPGRSCLGTGALHPGGPHTLRIRPLLTTVSAASLAAAPPDWMPSQPQALLPSPLTLSRSGRAQFLAPLPPLPSLPTPAWVTTSPYQTQAAPSLWLPDSRHCARGSPTPHGNRQAPPCPSPWGVCPPPM